MTKNVNAVVANLNITAAALESAVTELVELKAELAETKQNYHKFRDCYNRQLARAKCAEADVINLKTKLARTEESLEWSENRRVELDDENDNLRDALSVANADLLMANGRADRAEEKLARLEKCREQDFDYLLREFAYYSEKAAEYAAEGDDFATGRMSGSRDAIQSVVSVMWQLDLHAWHSGDMTLVEVTNLGKPIAFYHYNNTSHNPNYKVDVK